MTGGLRCPLCHQAEDVWRASVDFPREVPEVGSDDGEEKDEEQQEREVPRGTIHVKAFKGSKAAEPLAIFSYSHGRDWKSRS